MKKFFVIGLVLVIALFGFAKDYITVGTTDKIKILDPADCYDYFSSNVIQNTRAGLVDYEVGTANIVPWLAKSWEVSEDSLTYTFHLREDAKFRNGNDIDANALKFSFDRVIRLNGDPAFLISDVVAETKVVDKYTFQVTLEYPWSAFVSVLGYTVAYPVDPETTPADELMYDPPVASGPYYIEDWQPDVQLILKANPSYFGPKPKTETIVIKFYQNASTLRLALESGEIDLAYRTLDPRDLMVLKEDPRYVVFEGNSPAIRELVINSNIEPFDDLVVRKAIAYSVDRSAIVSDVFSETVVPLYTLVPIGMWSHENMMPERDLDKAREMLSALGYSEANPLEIELWYTPSHYGTTEADVAQVLKSSIEETGLVEVSLKYAEWSTYIDYFVNGTIGAFLLGWYPDYLDPDDYLWPFLSVNGAASMGAHYENPYVEEVMLLSRGYEDVTVRTELNIDIQKVLSIDVPYIPLWQSKQFCVTQPYISGVVLEPSQIFRYYLLEIEQ
ncbi:MAG: ABC transporter substrate-binding protein [Kosmotogaceae bacterium]